MPLLSLCSRAQKRQRLKPRALELVLHTRSHGNDTHVLPLEEAKQLARKMLRQQNPESALRQLLRANVRDAAWYALQGQILMSMRQYETAHQSFREAVRRDPNNQRYRQGALDAALAMKRNKDLPHKFAGWVKDKLNRR